MLPIEEPTKEKPRATARIDVPKELVTLFSPYKGLTLGESTTIEIKGKVRSIRQDAYGSSLEVELSGTQEEDGAGSTKEDLAKMKKRNMVDVASKDEE